MSPNGELQLNLCLLEFRCHLVAESVVNADAEGAEGV